MIRTSIDGHAADASSADRKLNWKGSDRRSTNCESLVTVDHDNFGLKCKLHTYLRYLGR